MTREQIIEAMARAGLTSEASAGVILRALETAIPGLADVIAGKAVVRPAVSQLQGSISRAEAVPAGPPALIVSLIVETEEHVSELPPQFQAQARAMIEAGKGR